MYGTQRLVSKKYSQLKYVVSIDSYHGKLSIVLLDDSLKLMIVT